MRAISCGINCSVFSRNMSQMTASVSKLLGSNSNDILEASNLLREGKLVAFPTETVYGLGANAFDERAVRSIFTAKGRPLTDPLIVHIPSLESAKRLSDISPTEMKLFELLGTLLWPGPLTMIVKAISQIPLCVTANTGLVGLRVPKHNLAKLLLEQCQLPIAAPSANRFGHVSPTKASHVYDDLGIGRGVSAIISSDDEVSCQHGIESTVIKADITTHEIHIYRQGAVTLQALESIVNNSDNIANLDNIRWSLKVVNRTVQMTADHSPRPNDEENVPQAVGQEAPGQAVTHYAPDNAVCMMTNIVHFYDPLSGSEHPIQSTLSPGMLQWTLSREDLKHTVIIDFHGQWNSVLNPPSAILAPASVPITILAYRDLSPSGSYEEAAYQLFDTLRWAETVPNIQYILVTPVLNTIQFICNNHKDNNTTYTTPEIEGSNPMNADIKYGIHDRLFRSTSGKIVQLTII